jgi:uncharacterized membrane protein
MKSAHKICFTIAIILAIASWTISIYYWDKLPAVIPVHFGISGQPDDWAAKSLFYVFLIPSLQSLMLAAFIFLYYRPQYSNIPTTMLLMTLDKKHREHAFRLIRIMLVGISLWIGFLFTYIAYGMNVSAMNTSLGLSPWLLFSIIGAMIIWLIYWSAKVYIANRDIITSIKQSKS